MQPRVFVSSTYYDLKYVRDRIELFLKRFSFEPVLFESDKVTFEHNKSLDASCYEEVKLCHMLILIVGGRYGSPSIEDEQKKEFQRKYEDEYISITRNEYETAVKNDMPIFIFVDKNVYSEYQTFKKNQSFFEQLIKDKKIENKEFSFAHVDNQNIFYFIESLQQKAIKQFDNVDEIENYLSNQFSGMFFLYLKQLQEKASNKKILDTINELNSVVSRMNTMVDGIGKEIIKEPGELQEINKKQFSVISSYFISTLFDQNIIKFDDISASVILSDVEPLTNIFWNHLFSRGIPDSFISSPHKKNSEEHNRYLNELKLYSDKLIGEINLELYKIDSRLKVVNIDIVRLYGNYKTNVVPFMVEGSDKVLKANLESEFFWMF